MGNQGRNAECGMRNVRVSFERHLASRHRPVNYALRTPHWLAVKHRWLLRAPGRSEPEVAVGARRGAAAARRTGEEPLLHEERFVDLLERSGVFAHRRRDRGQADGAPFELLDDRLEDA